MNQRIGALSRRKFVGSAAATAGAGAVAAAMSAPVVAAAVGPAASSVMVAATVVRTSHDRTAPGTLRVGVRASIVTPGYARDGLVMVVEGLPFGLTPAETGKRIAASVRSQVAESLRRSDVVAGESEIAVQVFGGAL